MAAKKKNKLNSKRAGKGLKAHDVFGQKPSDSPQTSELFTGDEKFYKTLEREAQAEQNRLSRWLGKRFSLLCPAVVLLSLTLLVVIVLQVKPSVKTSIIQYLEQIQQIKGPETARATKEVIAERDKVEESRAVEKIAQAKAVEKTAQAGPEDQAAEPQVGVGGSERIDEVSQMQVAEELEIGEAQPASWELAESFYTARDYKKAYLVYEKLLENLSGRGPGGNEAIRDFLKLKMALCLYEAEDAAGQNRSAKLFTECLQSRFPVVRALANFNLIFIEMSKGQYLDARMRVYRTMALVSGLEEYLSAGLWADCHFLVAQSVTREVLRLHNADMELPVGLWAVPMVGAAAGQFPEIGQAQLQDFLHTGLEQVSEGVLGPRIKEIKSIAGLTGRWSVVCFDSPVGEVLARFGSAAGLDVHWDSSADAARQVPVAIWLREASAQDVIEIVSGCACLAAQPEGRQIRDEKGQIPRPGSVTFINCGRYSQLAEHKRLLRREAMLLWQRFVSRWPGDRRMANAHFAMALVREFGGEMAGAIEEYELVASRFLESPLAPFALLSSSRARVKLRDYAGAKEALTELVTQYPDCRVADLAWLYLAEAAMQAGLYDEAARVFQKVYYLNQSKSVCSQGALGAAKCFYEKKDSLAAEKWFTRYLKSVAGQARRPPLLSATADKGQTRGQADQRDVGRAYILLGKTKMALGKLDEAGQAFEYALAGRPGEEEYAEVMLALGQVEMGRGNLLKALRLLEKIPTGPRIDERSCEILARKAQIFRAIGLPDSAIRILRGKVDYIADDRLRAVLLFELAKCYVVTGELTTAREILTSILLEIEPGSLVNEVRCELAEVCMKLGDSSQAISICRTVLKGCQRPGSVSGAGEAGLSGAAGDGTVSDSAAVQICRKALNILGTAYTIEKDYDKAALAFAGILDGPAKAKDQVIEPAKTGAGTL